MAEAGQVGRCGRIPPRCDRVAGEQLKSTVDELTCEHPFVVEGKALTSARLGRSRPPCQFEGHVGADLANDRVVDLERGHDATTSDVFREARMASNAATSRMYPVRRIHRSTARPLPTTDAVRESCSTTCRTEVSNDARTSFSG